MHITWRHVHRQAGANCTDAKLYFWTIFHFFLSKWDLDPPTHFQIIFGFLEFFLTLQSPLELFWDDFPKIFRVRQGPTHPLPFKFYSKHAFFEVFSLQSPLVRRCMPTHRHISFITSSFSSRELSPSRTCSIPGWTIMNDLVDLSLNPIDPSRFNNKLPCSPDHPAKMGKIWVPPVC